VTHQARKRFGQHFLVDETVIDGIVRVIDPQPGQRLVEIGPGLGAMTQPLLQRCGQLTVIELDRDLAARLRRQAGLTVVEADVLKVDFIALAGAAAQPLRIVGNLPYTATQETVRAHFASLNPVSVRCLTKRDDTTTSGATCRGIAFVEFANVWTMRTCLDKFHHSSFEDGKSAARKINVELT